MIVLAFLLAARQAALPTPEEVLKNINGFLSTAEHYSDELDLKADSAEGQPLHLHMKRRMDGKRFYFQTLIDDKPVIDLASTGNGGMVVDHANRRYMKLPEPPAPPEFHVPTDVEKDKIQFQVADRRLVFWANPELKTIQFDTQKVGEKTYRHYVAEAPRKEGKGKVRVELLILPDRWLVSKLDIHAEEDGKVVKQVHLTTESINTAATFSEGDFVIPNSVYSGYEETLPSLK